MLVASGGTDKEKYFVFPFLRRGEGREQSNSTLALASAYYCSVGSLADIEVVSVLNTTIVGARDTTYC
jgi:hypothetical protein